MAHEQVAIDAGYFADKEGNIYSNKAIHGTARKLIGTVDRYGYIKVGCMLKTGEKKTISAHRLVYVFFNGNIISMQTIDHLNGQKQDNRLLNLEVVTFSENSKRAHVLGLIKSRGEDNNQSKIKEADALAIMSLIGKGVSKKEIAKILNISRKCVYDVSSGVGWSHVTGVIRGTPRKQLSVTDVVSIKKLYSEGFAGISIAKMFNVSRACVSKIKLGKNWSSVNMDALV